MYVQNAQLKYSLNEDFTDNGPIAILFSAYNCGTSTLETYYSNFIARQLYAQKGL